METWVTLTVNTHTVLLLFAAGKNGMQHLNPFNIEIVVIKGGPSVGLECDRLIVFRFFLHHLIYPLCL